MRLALQRCLWTTIAFAIKKTKKKKKNRTQYTQQVNTSINVQDHEKIKYSTDEEEEENKIVTKEVEK